MSTNGPRASQFRFLALTGFCAALIFGSTACVSNSKKEEADLRMRIGTSFLQEGNHPAALRELLNAESLDPKNPVIQNNLGLAYFLREKHELAMKHLRRAIELEPRYSEARNNYARVLIELTRYESAIKELETVVNDLTYDQPAKAWVNMGLAYFRKGDYRAAKDRFLEAIKLDRNHCLGQTLYGRSLMELNNFGQAAQTLDNAVIICQGTGFDEPRYFSGLSYYKLGRTQSAIARMEEVIKLHPEGQYAKKAESMLKLMK